MTIEALTEGAVLTEDQIKEYGLKEEVRITGASFYTKGRRRFFLEPKEEGYLVRLAYDLSKTLV